MSGKSLKEDGFVVGVERSHGAALRRFLARRLRKSTADVPDIFQEIFLRLLRIRDHESIRNPQAYLYTIASHVLHQHALKGATAPVSMDPLELVSKLDVGAAPDPAEEAELQQRMADLARVLEARSPRAFAVLVMYRCEGMTLEEIGRRLGVSTAMARKYLTRAIAMCDQYLEEQDGA